MRPGAPGLITAWASTPPLDFLKSSSLAALALCFLYFTKALVFEFLSGALCLIVQASITNMVHVTTAGILGLYGAP